MLEFFDKNKPEKRSAGCYQEPTDGFLTGKLLVAAPILNGGYFDHSVICVCTHNEEGAMGLMLTQPLASIQFKSLLEQMNISTKHLVDHHIVHCGGPVDLSRGFVLHSTDVMHEESLLITDDLGVTSTLFMLEDIANGKGPKHIFFSLGYAGWDANQLEDELKANSWLTTDPTRDLLFHSNSSQKWDLALHDIGITPHQLAGFSGSA